MSNGLECEVGSQYFSDDLLQCEPGKQHLCSKLDGGKGIHDAAEQKLPTVGRLIVH